jgi:group II intron reverse transcriptase/maturase
MNVHKTKEHPEQWVREFQRKLYAVAKISPTRRFGILYDKVHRDDVLRMAWKRVKKKGKAPGVDKMTIKDVESEIGVDVFLSEIKEELCEETYGASSIRRAYIPKGKDGQRPLGIPTLKDKVVQMAVKIVIEPLFEAGFCECSYGFRPKRSNTQAANLVHKIVNWNKWVVDVDLKSYFDSIPHEPMMKLVGRRIGDKKILSLIRQWLKAGILEEGKLTILDKGTPQGGVLSPLLSNIYLHEIDKQWNDNATVKLVRFADDMVFLCKSEAQARWVSKRLKEQLTELGLLLNQEKTKICHVKTGFDFLGFTYKEAMSKRLNRPVRVKYPKSGSMQSIRRRIKTALKELVLGTSLIEAIGIINQKLRGWAQYYQIGNSYKAGERLGSYACRQLRLYWRRCKHRKDVQGNRKWKNSFFYGKGLYYVPTLLRG